MWIVDDTRNGIHVYPPDDVVSHELTDDCVCGVRNDPILRDDGSINWVVIHFALDGRPDGLPKKGES